MSEIEMAQGLEALRHAERAKVSGVLHDDAGPCLCSAGLVLGLLRGEAERLSPEGREWLEMLQTALENALESIRLLNYQTNPALAGRCGLRAALEFLTGGSEVAFDSSNGTPAWTPAQDETACRIVRDIILAIPEGIARLETSNSDIVLYGSGMLGLDSQQRSALRLIGKLHQLRVVFEAPAEAKLFSLGLLKAN
ncbi:MAG TPA: histidine kinase [Paludibaculum sp.]